MSDRDAFRLRHMLDAAHQAQAFVHGRARADLDHDRQLAFALVKAVEIIGEAGTQVGPEARQHTPGIPWDDIAGMRHRLVHAYFDIDLDILWQTVQEDVPLLIAELGRVIPTEDD